MNRLTGLLLILATSVAVSLSINLGASANTVSYIKLELTGSEIFKGDTIALDIESTGLLDPIDFGVIEQQATLIRETTGSRISVVGGKVQQVALRRMVIVPKRTGVVVIGPLVAGDVTSNSVHLKVLDAIRPEWTPLADDAQIKTTLTPENPVVNQQMLYKVELLHRFPINGESIELPDLNGFSKRKLIESRRTYTGENNAWFRTEWQTLIYPQSSGTIEIEGIKWSGTLAKSNVERATFARLSNPVRVNIAGAPSDYSGWWLPARSLELTDSWSRPPTELSAGDEIERTVSIRATDVLAGQLPTPLVPESRAIKQVLIKTERKESVLDKTIQSNAEFTYRVTAQSPIPVFLDTIRLRWWDTSEQNLKEAIIPARRINVGLPDRADLLSKIALEQNRFSQFRYRLQSMNMLRILSYLAAFIATLFLLRWFLPSLWQNLLVRNTIHGQTKRLKRLARGGDPQKLYLELQSAKSKALFDGAQSKLLSLLESELFSENTSTNTLDISLLSDYLEQAINDASNRNREDNIDLRQTRLADL